ncbi:MAG: hypothetical protein ACI4HL_06650, partial [Ruminococcus sp.]
MTKTLLKKQLKELLMTYFRSGNSKKKKSKAGPVVYALLMVYVAGFLFFFFYNMMNSLCVPLFSAGRGWLYFALAGIIAMMLAVFGSIFVTQSMLFDAKDNELLLSLPIPPSKILFTRMFSLYIQNFFFGGIVFLSAVVVYATSYFATPLSIVFCVLLFFIQPLLSLGITCIIAWLIALATARMNNKTIITSILSLAFLALYFFVYYQFSNYVQLLITNSKSVGASIKSALYPIYEMGMGATGDIKGFVIFTAITLAFFALIYWILSLSFIRIATTKSKGTKAKYRERELKVSSLRKTLFFKELKHFTKNSLYMLNCGLGSLFLIIGAVVIVVKNEWILELAESFPLAGALFALIGAGIICFIVSMNVVSAPTISLEGKTMWLINSLPIRGKDVLNAKLNLHFMVSAPFALICSIVCAVVLKSSVIMTVALILIPQLAILLFGEIDLLLSLKFAQLDWTNEAMVVKQSTSVVISLFLNWGIIIALGLSFFLIPEITAFSL